MDSNGIAAYLALGANLGDRIGALRIAVEALDAHPEIDMMRASPVYETDAHTLSPVDEQPPYLNAVVEVSTTVLPKGLLAFGHGLEEASGRERRHRWMARTLDIDVLVYGQQTMETGGLVLPHPRLAERRFVLQPWADLVPNLYVPTPFDATVLDLLYRCPDTDVPRRTAYQLFPSPNPF